LKQNIVYSLKKQLSQQSRDELHKKAQDLEVEGRSEMNKE